MRRDSCLRLLCIFLAGLMLLSTLPNSVLAEETPQTDAPTEAVTEPTETTPEEREPVELPDETETAKGPGLYFGLLHAHCSLSDGTGTAGEAYGQAAAAGLDFFALTDHSNSFDNDEAGAINADGAAVSADWAEGKAAAEAATTRDFVAVFGYEMTWQDDKQLGHMATFGTSGFQTRDQSGFSAYKTALPNYYDTLTSAAGSVSMFCHPGTMYGDFQDFGHRTPGRDTAIQLLELGEGSRALEYYTRALDLGWHVSPSWNQNNHFGRWGTADDRRTAVYASSLTEEGLLGAIRDYRVYATEDKDLALSYTLGGFFMGSRLERRHVGETAEISVTLSDPTDGGQYTLEVIAEGKRIASADCRGTAVLSVSTAYSYYYIVATQPDGDRAVSAPVWIDQEETVSLALTCDTVLPVRDQALPLKLTIQNGEGDPIHILSTQWFADGQSIFSTEVDRVTARGEKSWICDYSHPDLGRTEFTVRVEAEFCGQPRSYEATLELTFRPPEIRADILVDGAHGNEGLTELSELRALAEKNGLILAVAAEEPGSFSESTRALVVTAPEVPFSEDFLALTADFVRRGGCLILCGRSGGAEELNRLLEAAGTSLRLNGDTATDEMNNGGRPEQLLLSGFSRESWYVPVMENQVYRQDSGCTLSGGSWLVRGNATTVSGSGEVSPAVLAWESCGSGRVFAAGGSFLEDADLAVPPGLWSQPYANRTILEQILGIYRPRLPLSTIRQARQAQPGQVLRVRGYVTAGRVFGNEVFLQDDSGGIALTDIKGADFPAGTPLEVTGCAAFRQGNPVLKVLEWTVPEASHYRWEPRQLSYAAALDQSLHGGVLVQVEGMVVQFTASEDGVVSEFTLADSWGGFAVVEIGEGVVSGTDGENRLQSVVCSGREVRVIGISWLREDGVAVVRVRSCDEVVSIDPWPYRTRDASNPATGDGIGFIWLALILSPAGLWLILRKKSNL